MTQWSKSSFKFQLYKLVSTFFDTTLIVDFKTLSAWFQYFLKPTQTCGRQNSQNPIAKLEISTPEISRNNNFIYQQNKVIIHRHVLAVFPISNAKIFKLGHMISTYVRKINFCYANKLNRNKKSNRISDTKCITVVINFDLVQHVVE